MREQCWKLELPPEILGFCGGSENCIQLLMTNKGELCSQQQQCCVKILLVDSFLGVRVCVRVCVRFTRLMHT